MKTKNSRTNLYEFTIPFFVRGIGILGGILRHAERHAKANKYDILILLNDRLAPDMFSFTQQIQYAYFSAIDVVKKLTDVPVPTLAYDEKTVADLNRSLKTVVKYLKNIKKDKFDGAEDKMISLYWDSTHALRGEDYVKKLSIPNFYFHEGMAYAILRHRGVPLGKSDFISELPVKKIKGK